jgi:hypothetical protein
LGQQLSTSPCTEELFHAAQLCFGPTGIHIDAFAVTASTLSLDNGKHLSIAEARRSIEELARQRPDIARLSRGYSGSRAELASIIMSKLDDAGPSAFEPH